MVVYKCKLVEKLLAKFNQQRFQDRAGSIFIGNHMLDLFPVKLICTQEGTMNGGSYSVFKRVYDLDILRDI